MACPLQCCFACCNADSPVSLHRPYTDTCFRYWQKLVKQLTRPFVPLEFLTETERAQALAEASSFPDEQPVYLTLRKDKGVNGMTVGENRRIANIIIEQITADHRQFRRELVEFAVCRHIRTKLVYRNKPQHLHLVELSRKSRTTAWNNVSMSVCVMSIRGGGAYIMLGLSNLLPCR